jgi:hypothetical protein
MEAHVFPLHLSSGGAYPRPSGASLKPGLVGSDEACLLFALQNSAWQLIAQEKLEGGGRMERSLVQVLQMTGACLVPAMADIAQDPGVPLYTLPRP